MNRWAIAVRPSGTCMQTTLRSGQRAKSGLPSG
jgi:hypothetical protein